MTHAHGRHEIVGLQIARGLAAAAVVLHHTLEQSDRAARPFAPDWLMTAGAAGVDLFFVISGFIMLHVAFDGERQRCAPAAFLRRRLLRIYPSYWVCWLGAAAVTAGGALHPHFPSATVMATSFLLLPAQDKLIGISWTLIYELYFYLVFAAALVFAQRRAAVLATMAAIVGLFAFGRTLAPGNAASFLGNPVPLEFLFGVALAWAYPRLAAQGWFGRARTLPALLAAAVIPAVPLVAQSAFAAGVPETIRVAGWGLPALAIVASLLGVRPRADRWQRTLVRLGDASYALYLSHFFVMIGYGLLLEFTPLHDWYQPPLAAAAFAAAILTGLGFHRYVETPLLRLASRRPAPAPVRAQLV